jgi:RimJ/RimL family protein N-acetyltransferase
MQQPEVDRVIATTFERHHASVKILTRCKFICVGVDPNDAQADERDRQGRGKLMRFIRERPSV